MRVSAVDNNIAVIKKCEQLVNHSVNRGACLNHHKYLARLFKIINQLFKRVAADNILTACAAVYKIIYL